MKLVRSAEAPWVNAASYWSGLSAATAELDTPYGAISLQALAHNAFAMLDRAAGKPIRVASKSVRVREITRAVLELPGYAGVLAYTLPEALWLAETIRDVVVAYPTADRAALNALATSDKLSGRVTIMVDSVAQLDLVDAVLAPNKRESIRVAIELDSSWDAPLLGHAGVFRSPVHSPSAARALAETVVSRPGFTLVGMMGYEAQIAGLANKPASSARGVAVRWIQRRSIAELADRRGAAVKAVRAVADLEFVNGGGTGSIESTAADESVTEIAAGSGLFGPHLFDQYTHFRPAPAAAFALSVVRKPMSSMATILGGGWIASGPTSSDRQPQLAWPKGLTMVPREMGGEVQTPLTGRTAATLKVGDRVWLRHTKAGELSEHLNAFAIVDGLGTGTGTGTGTGQPHIVETVPTYRGEGKAFL
ncbi:MAG: alanine racemase [Glaciihabitans sp.]|nr:alanine racemase [Glaciihabitans sp.]